MENKEIKQIVVNIFENVDGIMSENGFNRRKNGFVYSRNINKVKQKIELVFSVHPLGQPNALAQIYPWLSVYYPEINELAINVLGEDFFENGLHGLTLRQPVLVGANERWFVYDKSDTQNLASSIAHFFQENTIPFLNSLVDIASYLMILESQDKRLIMDDRQHIYFAFAYALSCDYDKGFDLLEKRFRKSFPTRYPELFEYFTEHL